MLGETSDDESDVRLHGAHELAAEAQPAQWSKRAGSVENAWAERQHFLLSRRWFSRRFDVESLPLQRVSQRRKFERRRAFRGLPEPVAEQLAVIGENATTSGRGKWRRRTAGG